MLGGKSSPHTYAQQNFRIFLIGIPLRGKLDYILWIASIFQACLIKKALDKYYLDVVYL